MHSAGEIQPKSVLIGRSWPRLRNAEIAVGAHPNDNYLSARCRREFWEEQMSNAGWHPDPYAPHQNRYFDGVNWTQHVAPLQPPAVAPIPQYTAPTPQYMAVQQTTVVNQAPQKSVGVALLLTFFFGPLGMLYSTVAGGLIMLVLDFILGIVTFGLWFIVAWPIQMVWAAVAASNSGSNVVAVANTMAVPAHQPAPQYYAPQPQYQVPYQPAPALPPAQPMPHATPLFGASDASAAIERQLPISTTSYEVPNDGPPPWYGSAPT